MGILGRPPRGILGNTVASGYESAHFFQVFSWLLFSPYLTCWSHCGQLPDRVTYVSPAQVITMDLCSNASITLMYMPTHAKLPYCPNMVKTQKMMQIALVEEGCVIHQNVCVSFRNNFLMGPKTLGPIGDLQMVAILVDLSWSFFRTMIFRLPIKS